LSDKIGNAFEKEVFKRTPSALGQISLQWHQSPNFGDHLSVYLAEKMSGLTVRAAERESQPHYMVTGSILSLATEKSIVWGAGIAYRQEVMSGKPASVHMVRGRYSNDVLRQNGIAPAEVLGDPGYILSHVFNPDIEKRYKVGVIPHWIDMPEAIHCFSGNDDLLIVDLMNDTESVIRSILSCEVCVSTSLHGIVVAHSYGIPCLHIRLSNKILGDGVKYLDYFSSVGIDEYEPVAITGPQTTKAITTQISSDVGDRALIPRMIAACPFKTKGL
jgi:hypothetical protein